MATIPAIPTLSGIGWATEPNTKLSVMFNYMFESEHDQSTIYSGSITSIPFEIERNGGNPNALANELQRKLTVYFTRAFQAVTVKVTTISDEKDSAQYQLNIDVVATENGVEYSLGKVLSVDANKLTTNLLSAINAK